MTHSFSKVAAGSIFGAWGSAESVLVLIMIGFTFLLPARAQDRAGTAAANAPANASTSEGLQQRVGQLEGEVAELKRMVKQLQSNSQAANGAQDPPNAQSAYGVPPQSASLSTEQSTLTSQDRKTLGFLRDTTINIALDGYYEYNFNAPIGRVNLLRAYDVLSNSFSLNQADVIVERLPDVADGRRFGGRLDLQFGQATDTLQGNPANEPRPDIYRNIFQAYGTYVAPIGRGVNIDFGKFASSIGLEGNYTKDQMNYSRSFWFDFLPFYHMGLRANYQVNDQLSVNYWMVNGANQTEPVNGYKDELVGVNLTPTKNINWTVNYYLGQEHPDFQYEPVGTPGLPEQQGNPFEPIANPAKGKLHIFDSYVTWNASPKLTFALEGDYVIERLQIYSQPVTTDGGAAYVRYQLLPKIAIAARSEYLADGGLFSGKPQALK